MEDKKRFTERLAALVDVKSIVTLMLAIVFCYLAISNIITGQEFLTIFTVIISFYFGTQHAKKEAEIEENKEG